MLKRIKDIKAVGCFSDARSAGVQFDRLTFIYGENCYGKTTLCDVFRSFAENRPDYISARVSVPNPKDQPQLVQLGFTLPGEVQETTYSFDGDAWNLPLPPNIRLLVFDTDFIHRNVFTGLTIERENRENLTEFIIGEASVAKALDIEDKSSKLRALKKRTRQMEDDVFEGIDDLETFVALKVREAPEKIQERIKGLEEKISTNKNLRDNLTRAMNRNEPQPIDLPDGFTSFVERVNNCLTSTYERAHKDAEVRVHQHIEHKTKALRTTEQWLRQGLDHMLDNQCPFCGQSLQVQAQKLLSAYREFFNEAFNQFVSKTTTDLEQLPVDINQFSCIDLPQSIRDNESFLAEYPELAKEEGFAETVAKLSRHSAVVMRRWQSWQTRYEEAKRTLSACISAKQAAVHTKAEPWECSEVAAAYARLMSRVSVYNEVVRQLLDRIAEFKRGLNTETINQKITSLERRQEDRRLKQRRLQLDDACARYTRLTEKSSITKQVVDRLREELQQEQAQFLDDYFETINSIFSMLGSGPFRISKEETRRGNMPVIQLTASYSDVPITSDSIRAFFSESDRRALALSIFWAKADLLTDPEKKLTILILDDPVTSFDDGRVDRTIRLMDNARTSFRQVIVLSHYPRFLKSFFDRAYSQTKDIQVASILKTDKGSQLNITSSANFVESEHQAKFRHISNFIDRKHREDICQDLRVYFENEVKFRYWKQITDGNLTEFAFADLCDELYKLGAFSQRVRDEIEEYRLSLNPAHHKWTGLSHEDKIALARDVLNFIYERL